MIGSNLVKSLVVRGDDVYVADNFWRGKRENLLNADKSDYVVSEEKIFDVDLRDFDSCAQVLRGIEVCYHLADVVAGINFVFENELFLWRSNILINSNVLQASIDNGVKDFIYVGTACSYPKEEQSQPGSRPFREEDVYPADPESSYGWSKLMGEYEVELAGKENAINTGILRLHNVYGSPAELNPSRSQVIPALCRKAILFPSESFTVWGSGNQRRAFVHVDDVVDALIRVHSLGMGKGVIQIGPPKSVSVGEIAERIVGLSSKKIPILFDKSRPEGDFDRAADGSKAERILGWTPNTSLESGLLSLYSWVEQELQVL